ncbi:MAG: hypothetical protein MUC49_11815 [Raineya sp.]|nr:hypothetical protein [Raineya sp.]
MFFNIFIGINIFTIFNAIFYTNGKTIFSLSLVFLPFFYWVYVKKNKQKNDNISLIDNSKSLYILFNSICFFTIIFTIRFFDIYYSNINMFVFIHPDYLTYGRTGYWLQHTGIEHFLANPISYPTGVAPYHYFDNWLNVGIAAIGNINYSVSWVLITFSIITFSVWLGFCSILNYINFKKNTILPIVAFIGIGICGIYIHEVYEKVTFLKSIVNLLQNIWIYPKLSIIYLYLCATLIFFLQEKHKYAYLVLTFLTLVYTTTAPSIFCSLGIILCILLMQRKLNDFWFLLSLIIVSSCSLWGFYQIFKIPSESNAYSTGFFEKLKITQHIFIDKSIYILVLYAPLFIFILFFKKKALLFVKNNTYIWLVFLIPIFALGCSSIFTDNIDAHQIFENISFPILNILAFIILAIFVENKKIWVSLLISGVIIINFSYIYTYNDTFPHLNQTSKLKELYEALKNKNHIGVSFRDVTKYENVLLKNTNWNMAGSYISTMFSDFFVVELNVHQTPIKANSKYHENESIIMKNAPFYKYVEEQKKKRKFISIEKSQINFIQDYKVDFIITDKEYKIPNSLNILVKYQIDFENDKYLFINRDNIKNNVISN